MNHKSLIFSVLIILLTSSWQPVHALDLSKYQSFLSNKTNSQIEEKKKDNTKKSSASKTILKYEKKPSVNEFNDGNNVKDEEADASFRDNRQPIPEKYNKDKRDGLFLPGETRIPEGLKSLLTDRKNPKEGVSLSGGTGAILIPSPGVIEPGKTAVAVHVLPFDVYNVNDKKYEYERYFDTSSKIVFGVTEGFELGLEKTFSNQDQYDIANPLFIHTKYQVPGNVTLGGCFSTNTGDAYSSVWVSAGVPALWVGAGGNFGPNPFKFFYRGWDLMAKSRFGGYNYDYSKAQGYADPVWFMVGGTFSLSNYLNFVYDFNGDKFSLGFRANYQKTVFLDISYISDGDYERMPGAITHKQLNNLIFGGSIVY
ncbi:MAG: hypothetical protein HQM10_01165 [Candidatus Riflebacteria bacterium]|nr:hypothetical protein [Candidatus Riflebacteria bacterium]